MLEGRISYYNRDYERAVRELHGVIDREPGFHLAHYFLGLSYGYLGRISEAEAELQAAGLSREELRFHVAWVRARNGRKNMAENVLENGARGTGALFLAAQLGQFDRAFEILDDALERGLPLILSLRAEPRFDALRADARFSKLLARTEPERANALSESPVQILRAWQRH
jgi:tetratricopeptide (TPR) repeat protein